jgi:hypothetical protein
MRLGSWFKASRSASTSRQRGIAPLRRDDGEGYRELLTRMAQESGIETPTAEDLPRVDRKWKGKTPPNADWKNRPTGSDASVSRGWDYSLGRSSRGGARPRPNGFSPCRV